MQLSNRKITCWDSPGFDRDEEYGDKTRNARGKRYAFVKAFRKLMNRKLRYNKKFKNEE